MTERCIGHAAVDVGDGREWRVHQHDAGDDAGVEMIVDVGGIERGHRDAGKEERQKSRAGFGQLVEGKRSPGEFGEDRKQPGAGRRLQDNVSRRDRGGQARSPRRWSISSGSSSASW